MSENLIIAGLDIGEHGNLAYPDFAPSAALPVATEDLLAEEAPVRAPAAAAASMEQAVPVVRKDTGGNKLTKISIITSQAQFALLEQTLTRLGVTGITMTNVLGYGLQKGHQTYFRGSPVETRLLPKIKVEVVISKIPTDLLVNTVQKALYTGNIGDGKIFVYDVEDVVKIRTNEHGYDALQDEV